MTSLVSNLKRPIKVEFNEINKSERVHTFQAKPYERGFATTIGNSIRRTLLSVIPGYAVVAVKVSGVNNEFQNIPGVYQDTIEVLSNLKNLAIGFKDHTIPNKVFHFDVKGKTTLKAKDFLKQDKNVLIGNGEHEILTTNTEADFSIDIQVERGRGYVSSDLIQERLERTGVIPLDANYSPILKSSFEVVPLGIEKGHYTEGLRLTIETNGVVEPKEALNQAAQILQESYMTFGKIVAKPLTTAVEENWTQKEENRNTIFYESVFKIPFAVRTHFFLKVNEIKEIGQLVAKEEEDLKLKKHYNEFILEDIMNKLKQQELALGMKNIDYVQKASY